MYALGINLHRIFFDILEKKTCRPASVPMTMRVTAYIGLKIRTQAALYELGPSMSVPLIPRVFSNAGLITATEAEPVKPKTQKAIAPSFKSLVQWGLPVEAVQLQNLESGSSLLALRRRRDGEYLDTLCAR